MDNPTFVASIQRFLATLDISEFKPGERAPMSKAKQRALRSMENPADAAARQFATTWPGDLATVADLREFIGDDAPSHSGAMRHVIERAGMKTARQLKVASKVQTVLIVRGTFTPYDLETITNNKIVATIIKAQSDFRAII